MNSKLVFLPLSAGVDWDKCWNYGLGPAGGGTYVLQRARRHLNKSIYYHLLTCNCEHYVKFWTEQNYNVNQSGSPASSYCSFFKKDLRKHKGTYSRQELEGIETNSVD